MFDFWSKFNKNRLSRIYLDTAATTPLAPSVLSVMYPYLVGDFGNPSSFHCEGRLAKKAIEESRASIKRNLHIDSGQIIFTGSGTEANNLALLGAAKKYLSKNKKPGVIICSAIDHHSVLDTLKSLENNGFNFMSGPRAVPPPTDGLARAPPAETASQAQALNQIALTASR